MKRTVFVLAMFFLLSGCASIPQEKGEVETKIRESIFYPPLPQRPRLQFLHSITSEDDIGEPQSALEEFLLGKTQSEKRIERPYDLGASKGKIYILDRNFKKILIIDLVNRKFDYIEDKRLGTLNDPSGIWISEDDIKYVADMGRKQIVAFDAENEFLRAYGDGSLFDKPVDVATYGDRIYACDLMKNQIFVFDKETGEHKKTIGKMGKGDGEFYRPSHITVDHSGNLFVTDAFNYRVQMFDLNCEFVRSYGQQGDTPGSFARPKGIAIDREGHLYVADAAFENVQIFDTQSGDLLLFFGGAGNAPGSMYLPAGISIDYNNMEYFSEFTDKDFRLKYLFYVLNFFGRTKLNVYGFGEWVGSPLPGEKGGRAVQQGESEKGQ